MSKLAHVWYGGSLRARLVTLFTFVTLSLTSARSVANGVSSKSHLPIPSSTYEVRLQNAEHILELNMLR